MHTVKDVLEARGVVYGPFIANALCSQELKMVIHAHNKHRGSMDADMREALEVIAAKMARVLTGDPTHLDNWIDIAGYAQLIVNRLSKP